MKLEIINGKIRVTPAFVMHRSEERLYEIKKLRHRVCCARVREAMIEKNLIGWPKYRSEHAVMKKDPEYQWLAQIGKQSFDRLAELRAGGRQHARAPAGAALVARLAHLPVLAGHEAGRSCPEGPAHAGRLRARRAGAASR